MGTGFYLRVLLGMIAFTLGGEMALGQAPNQGGSNKIEIIKAQGISVRDGMRYIKSGPAAPRVIFRRDSALFYCDLAIQAPETKNVRAYGNIMIKENEGSTITSDTLYYNNVTNFAEFRGNVVMIDSATRLTTEQLFYNLDTRDAYYVVGGRVNDNGNILTSKKGWYRTTSKTLAFKGEVELDDPKAGQRLETDSMLYYMDTEIAYFYGNTEITSRDGQLQAENGNYNTVTDVFTFEGNAVVDNEDYTLKGDNMYSNRVEDINVVKGNVELFYKEETTTIYGDEMHYREAYGNSKVFGYAMMKRPFGKEDSLFLAADTLLAINDTINNVRQMHAFYNVRIFSNTLQGRCDSLVYDYVDSTLQLFIDPVIWNGRNQIKANQIKTFLSEQSLDSMHLISESFVIQEDTLKNYNQIKGRNMTAWFNENEITQLYVDGNVQSLYFSLQGDTLSVGMNKMESATMTMTFADSSRLEGIVARNQVSAKFTPTHELLEPDTRLPGFRLRFGEKPLKHMLTSRAMRIQMLENPPTEDENPPSNQRRPSIKTDVDPSILREKNPTLKGGGKGIREQ